MRVYFEDDTYESLNDSHFISQGGQGSVYAKDDLAYKIYTDKNHAIPESKIKELSIIPNEDVIKPEYPLFDVKGNCIGYAMKQVHSDISLCQVLNHAYKTKHNISTTTMLHLLEDMQQKIQDIHSKDILIVDFNEMNFLIDENDYSKSYFIDVDSYQTPNHSAGAIAEHIRDRHTKGFTKDSDWFSFSIVAFRLLTGLHPYKGRHKVYKKLDERMLANVSAFNSEVKLPAICPSFDIIPSQFRGWLESVLEKGERSSPPAIVGSVLITPTYTVNTISGLGNFKITLIKEFQDKILRYFETEKEKIYVTSKNTWVDNVEIDEIFDFIHQEDGKTYLVKNNSGKDFIVYDYANKKNIENNIQFDKIFNINNKLCYKKGNSVYKIKVDPIGKGFVTSHLLCNVMENATQVFDNVLVQNMLGNFFVSIFDMNESHFSVKIPELNDYKIIEAKYENKVLIVKGVRKYITKEGKFEFKTDKLVVVFHRHLDNYVVRKIEDVGDEEVNMSVIGTKNIACHIRKNSIELFSNDMKLCNQIKSVEEDDPSTLMATKSSNFLTAIDGNKAVTITMGKPDPPKKK